MVEIKPCPFCGDDAVDIEEIPDNGNIYYVYCIMCAANGPVAGREIDAVDKWNEAKR